MPISSTQSVRENWLEAANDGVVSNAEIHAIYMAARASGVSTQDLLRAAKTTSIAADVVREASRAEREAQGLSDTEKKSRRKLSRGWLTQTVRQVLCSR